MTVHNTRQGVIAHNIKLAQHHGALTMNSFAADVAAHYLHSVPLALRTVPLQHTLDPDADEKHNAQVVNRFLDGTVRMPVEIEESLVLSLPQPFRNALQRDLAERLGLLAAPLPREDHARATVSVAELLKETGELLQALAPMLADGKIDSSDAPNARRALAEVRDVMGRCASIETQLITVLANEAEQHKVARLRGVA